MNILAKPVLFPPEVSDTSNMSNALDLLVGLFGSG